MRAKNIKSGKIGEVIEVSGDRVRVEYRGGLRVWGKIENFEMVRELPAVLDAAAYDFARAAGVNIEGTLFDVETEDAIAREYQNNPWFGALTVGRVSDSVTRHGVRRGCRVTLALTRPTGDGAAGNRSPPCLPVRDS